MKERDISAAWRAQKLGVPTPDDQRGVGSRPALLEGRASDCYHPNQQVIIEFCQRERSSNSVVIAQINIRSRSWSCEIFWIKKCRFVCRGDCC